MNTETPVMIGEEDYLFVKQYQESRELRGSLNQLTQRTFGFDFEDWYQRGLWTDRYRPYSLVHKNRIVANVSVNPIEFDVRGKLYSALQLGTVMTAPEYRNKGLSRALFEIVLKEYEGQADLTYLYANDTVKQFYPRFGFTAAREYIYSKQYTRDTKYSFNRLNGADKEAQKKLLHLVGNTKYKSKYSMVYNPYLTMFHLTGPLADCCYYCEELGLAAVVEYEEERMLVQGLFCEEDFDMNGVIASLLDRERREVFLGFTPLVTEDYHCSLLQEPDTTFFVKGTNFIVDGRLPILSHA